MRGKQRCNEHSCSPIRIIPARAGQTAEPSRTRSPWPDHPRACGANSAGHGVEVAGGGSSPRVRGKPRRDRQGRTNRRIIPARAGQTAGLFGYLVLASDHPRACGANGHSQSCSHNPSGSSPRVRGKLHRAADRVGWRRIIPARAGQTCR